MFSGNLRCGLDVLLKIHFFQVNYSADLKCYFRDLEIPVQNFKRIGLELGDEFRFSAYLFK